MDFRFRSGKKIVLIDSVFRNRVVIKISIFIEYLEIQRASRPKIVFLKIRKLKFLFKKRVNDFFLFPCVTLFSNFLLSVFISFLKKNVFIV